MQERLFWEQFRPKTLNQMILLPRIKADVRAEDGTPKVSTNLLLTGSPGTGKSTLARIIQENYDTLTINASLKSSIEDLKSEVMDFCRTMSTFSDDYKSDLKVVFLDEFDGVSRQYQDGLRAFIEEYEQRVRFVATCNNISKISDAMLSRFTVIKFNPVNATESEMLKAGYLRRATAVCNKVGIEITQDRLSAIITASFPDYRSVFNKLQMIHERGDTQVEDEIAGDSNVVYDIILNTTGPEATFDYVMTTWGDKVDGLVAILGRPFAKYIFQYRPELTFNVVAHLIKVRDYEIHLADATDPALHAMALIYEMQSIYKNK